MHDFDAAVARVGAVCSALPEARDEDAWVGTRWKVRANTFAHVLPIAEGWPPSFAAAAGTNGPAVVLTFRSSSPELDALLADGRSFFGPLWGRGDIGVVLNPDVDWAELAELLIESYRLRAPRSLVAQLADGLRR
jgi:hypothetical protein